jgi:hypothetical protein
MAKIGETDPRWIVAERNDGANVNGWHWQERNCMGWGRERLSGLLVGEASNNLSRGAYGVL